MALLQRPQPQTPGAVTTVASRLLRELFAGFEPDDHITVLDLGPGNASTVAFLSQYRAKVYFADLLAHAPPVDSSDEVDTAEFSVWLQQQLALPANVQFDVCLMWDYLHYLDLPTLAALSSVLQPYLHRDTRGYAFGALHGKKPTDSNSYGIADLDNLAAVPMQNEPVYLPHSQQRLSEHFAALRIARGTLLREGRLELLLESY